MSEPTDTDAALRLLQKLGRDLLTKADLARVEVNVIRAIVITCVVAIAVVCLVVILATR